MIHTIAQKNGHVFLMLSVLCLGAVAGCTGVNSANMVPELNSQLLRESGRSIRSVTVRGEQDSVFGGPSYATPEQIHSAVVSALSQSGFFQSVDADQGDLDLSVIVRSQGQDVSKMLEYAGKITMTYRFTDTAGNVTWSKTLESTGSSHAFAGAKRTTEARERTVKANLTALLAELNETWP